MGQFIHHIRYLRRKVCSILPSINLDRSQEARKVLGINSMYQKVTSIKPCESVILNPSEFSQVFSSPRIEVFWSFLPHQ